jgi:transposase, IS5 family
MIRYQSEKQPSLEGFDAFFHTELDRENRWVKLSRCIPWDALAVGYYRNLSKKAGRPAKDARMVIGAVIIKHKLCLSDEETIEQIKENAYLQYFLGLSEFQKEAVFAPSLFVEIRRRMGEETFLHFHQAVVDAAEEQKAKVKKKAKKKKKRKDDDPDDTQERGPKTEEREEAEEEKEPLLQGKLILDATVAEQAIRFPTDLDLLNEARETAEQIIDVLYRESDWRKKPRDYRRKARKAYLAVAKRRRPQGKVLRKGRKQQLQYLRRDLGHIEKLLDSLPGLSIPLSKSLLRKYWVIQHLYTQQLEMYRTNARRCDDRIVSIHQPQVRPIVRGKRKKSVEFGAKLSVSLTEDGIASVDRVDWNAFNEGGDLMLQVKRYKERFGHYPEAVLGDQIYGTRKNRKELKKEGIRFAGKPLGRPRKITEENKEEINRLRKQRRDEYRERIPIEGKFGQGKNGYGLSYIRAKTAKTSEAWINSIFFVMNLMVLEKIFLLPQIIHAFWRRIMAKITFKTENGQNPFSLTRSSVQWPI